MSSIMSVLILLVSALQDPCAPVRNFIKAFNDNMVVVLKPGLILVVDEIMCMWLGLELKYSWNGLPHLTKLPRKPRGVGAEMKAMCCGESGVLLRLNLMEGKERMQRAEFADQYQAGTATVLRLCNPFKGRPRIVVTDSAFSSVNTLVAVRQNLGMYFMGAVKTAHTKYPKQLLTEWFNQGVQADRPRGAWTDLEAKYGVIEGDVLTQESMYALDWQEGNCEQCGLNCSMQHRQHSSRGIKRLKSKVNW
jgi:hypothetical protein